MAVKLGCSYKENKPILAASFIKSNEIADYIDKGFQNGKSNFSEKHQLNFF